jgi:hypothetical protein
VNREHSIEEEIEERELRWEIKRCIQILPYQLVPAMQQWRFTPTPVACKQNTDISNVLFNLVVARSV